MATATFVSIEEYLRTTADPDCEYVDGEIEERPMPEYDHATWQGALVLFFAAHGREWNVRSRPELRVRVSPTRYRVPDVTVVDRATPIEQIVVTPPLAVFEILSLENRMTSMMKKFADYERMGIAGIWVIEPKSAIGYRYEAGGLDVVSVFGLPTLGITFTLEEIATFID